MNHVLTEHDLQPQRNVWAQIVIQTMEDLNPEDKAHYAGGGRWKNWVAEFREFHEMVRELNRAESNGVRFIPDYNALKMWAKGNLETHGMDRFDGRVFSVEPSAKVAARLEVKRQEQLKYNILIKRWIDRVYGHGDAMLTAMIVIENPGLITEYAQNAGMKTDTAREAEKRVASIARGQLARLIGEFRAESPTRKKLMERKRIAFTVSTRITKEDIS